MKYVIASVATIVHVVSLHAVTQVPPVRLQRRRRRYRIRTGRAGSLRRLHPPSLCPPLTRPQLPQQFRSRQNTRTSRLLPKPASDARKPLVTDPMTAAIIGASILLLPGLLLPYPYILIPGIVAAILLTIINVLYIAGVILLSIIAARSIIRSIRR